jgi:hypothetical protein
LAADTVLTGYEIANNALCETDTLEPGMRKTAKSKPKTNEKNPRVLGAEVCRTGKRRVLGKIVKVTKSLLTVQWDTGSRELYGRRGQAFYGHAGSDGEAITSSPSGKLLEDLWGGEDDVRITIPTEGARKRITQGLENEAKVAEQRAAAQAKIESDPAYQMRQGDLERYTEALRGLGHVENGWNDHSHFRIELDGITPAEMDAMVEAICSVRAKK